MVRSASAPAAGVSSLTISARLSCAPGGSGLSRPRQRVARPQGTRASGSRGVIWDSVVWGTQSAERGASRGSVGMLVLGVGPTVGVRTGRRHRSTAALVTAQCRSPAVGRLLLRSCLTPRGPRWLPRLPRHVRVPPAAVMRRGREDVLEKWLVALLPGSHACASFLDQTRSL